MKFSFSEKARLRTTSQSASQTMPDCGSQRLLRCRLHPAGRGPNSDSLFPPLAAVVAVAPGRGASGEEARLYGMPRTPLDRSNNDDRRQWRKQGVAVGAAASKTQAKRCGCWVPQPDSGSHSKSSRPALSIASQEISATFKQHICDMQFNVVAVALKS